MSQREITLKDAIELLRQSKDYNEYRRNLGIVVRKYTNEEERQKVLTAIEETKKHLINTNEDFKTKINDTELEARMQMKISGPPRLKNTLKHIIARKKSDLDEWVEKTKFKTVTTSKLKKKKSAEIGCPNPRCVEYGKNMGNIVNNIPACMRCMHKLVSKSEFKDYNRAYWRRYNKKR